MDFKNLDKLFDASVHRAVSRKDPLTGAYGEGPLAEDHFLLARSWAYFRDRMRDMETQWDALLKSKAAEIEALERRLAEMQAAITDLQDDNKALRAFEESVKELRARDLGEFDRDAERLKIAWESERENLEKRVADLQFKLDNQSKFASTLTERDKARIAELMGIVQTLRLEIATAAEEQAAVQRKFSKDLLEKDENVAHLQLKIDRLRAEVERRDLVIRGEDELNATQEKKNAALKKMLEEAESTIAERGREIGTLKLRLEIVTKEKEAIRTSWEKEQAQWRELWERGREQWEKRAAG